jgi:uncharacterized protein
MASDNQGGRQGGQRGSSNRGFASMDPERQRQIASQGGKAAHQSGNAHEFTSEEAREAGRKSRGGQGSKAGASGSRSASPQQQEQAGGGSQRKEK